LFFCKASAAVAKVCEQIRKTYDVGLITGAAGVGKTCGGILYQQENPSAIRITVNRWNADPAGIEGLLMAELETRGFKANEERPGAWLVRKLAGSYRIVIIDNAQRLPEDSLKWVFDFHDATECPVALIGNPEVLDKIRANDQLFSRIGICEEIEMKDPEKVAGALLKQFCPEHADALLGDATEIVKQAGRGHGRTLRKQLLIFRDFIQTDAMKKTDPADVFKSAGSKLVKRGGPEK
jgi:DNA transposition AAA+ family ATPase